MYIMYSLVCWGIHKRIHNIAKNCFVCWKLFGVLGAHANVYIILLFWVWCAGTRANVYILSIFFCLVCWDIRKRIHNIPNFLSLVCWKLFGVLGTCKRIHNIANGVSWLLKLFWCVWDVVRAL